MFTIRRKKIVLLLHISGFYLITTLMMNYYLGDALLRWFFQTLLFSLGIFVSASNWGKKGNLIVENLIGLLFMIVFVVQSVTIWEGYYVLKDILAIAFTWGLSLMSFYLISKRLLTNFYAGAFILMIYDASISYDLLYLVFAIAFTFLSISFFIFLVPPLERGFGKGIKISKEMFSVARTSLGVTLIGFVIALLIYSVLPRFWNVNFFNLPITRNQNYFAPPDTSGRDINIPGFSLEFSLTSGKVWDSPIEVMEVKTNIPAKVHYLKGAVYDTFDGRNWTMSNINRIKLKNMSWQFKMELEKSDYVKYQSDTQIITYLITIPNVLFYESYPEVIRFPSRFMMIDDSSNIFVPPIAKFPFKYSVVSQIPVSFERSPMNILSEEKRRQMCQYLTIPIISDRAAGLVNDITRDTADDLEKAVLLAKYLKESYTYDMEFSFLPEENDLVDYFLFEYKKGYCEQFATVFAIMLRQAGIPSRTITGFAGGEYAPGRGAILFRGENAHAWVEAYFENFGWLTMDATPVSSSGQSGQRTFLQRLLGRFFSMDPQNLVPLKVRKMISQFLRALWLFLISNILLMLFIAAGVIALWIIAKIGVRYVKRRRSMVTMGYCALLFSDFTSLISRRFSVKRDPWETESEYVEKLTASLPELADAFREFLSLMLYSRYSTQGDKGSMAELERNWHLLRSVLKKHPKSKLTVSISPQKD